MITQDWNDIADFDLSEYYKLPNTTKTKTHKPPSPVFETNLEEDDIGTVGSTTYKTANENISSTNDFLSTLPTIEKQSLIDDWFGEGSTLFSTMFSTSTATMFSTSTATATSTSTATATSNSTSTSTATATATAKTNTHTLLYNHQESSQNSFLELPSLNPSYESVPVSKSQYTYPEATTSSIYDEPWSNMSFISIEYNNKWPAPQSIKEIAVMCQGERKKGTSRSQLALCLHFMECASRMDSNDSSNGSKTSQSRSQFKKTLEGALIYAAKSLLKQLATSSQGVGRGGESEAQYLLGNCYGMGAFGWPISHESAFQWYTQASKQDHPEATYRAAVCYELGIGTSKDGARAILFYRKAALLNNAASMYKLGIIYMRGYCDQPISKREAVTWLQRAAATAVLPTITSNPGRRSLPHALHALAIIQLTGECNETSLISDTHYAIQLLEQAARLGYAPSQSKLGECYECGIFCEMDESQSLYWYTQAVKQDFPEAALALSGWYLTGSLTTNILPQSDHEAYLWARRAATLVQTHSSASLKGKVYFTVGIYYQHGIGVKKSIPNAFKWFKKAACAGHLGAFKILTSLSSQQ